MTIDLVHDSVIPWRDPINEMVNAHYPADLLPRRDCADNYQIR